MSLWFPTVAPPRVFASIGVISVYWYSLIMIAAVLAAYFIARRLYLRSHTTDTIFADLSFYMVIWGLVGARLWHVFIFQWPYYSAYPVEILQIWHGGIAIQGALAGGFISLYIYSRIHKLNLWEHADRILVGVVLGQAIGRWGNFFNQELYGLPTKLPWALYIEPQNRVPGFEQYSYFHPAFFYESFLDFGLFLFLWSLSKKNPVTGRRTAYYFIGYGLIRFLVDFFRIDPMPMILGLRYSQIVSLLFVLGAIILYRRSMKIKPAV